MAELPNDVMIDILICLSVKSLLRFRCVSKLFRALIDGPDFIHRHLHRSLKTKTNRKLILRSSYLFSMDLDRLDQTLKHNLPIKHNIPIKHYLPIKQYHPLNPGQFLIEILGSANGLLCVYNGEDIVICNLATRNYQKLPVTEIELPGPPDSFYRCHFIVYGFGYDSVSDDYKLLRLVQFYKDINCFDSEAKVYSLRSNSWQRIKDFPYYLCYKRGNGELACGALHWIICRKCESDIAYLIAAFDLSTNEYRLVDQPDFCNMDFSMNVREIEGCLCLLCNYVHKRVDVWVMKDYGVKESWSKVFSISQPKDINLFVYPLAYSKSGDEILLVQGDIKLLWFIPKEGKVRMINIRGSPKYFEPSICVESLVPLSGKTEDYAKKWEGKRTNK